MDNSFLLKRTLTISRTQSSSSSQSEKSHRTNSSDDDSGSSMNTSTQLIAPWSALKKQLEKSFGKVKPGININSAKSLSSSSHSLGQASSELNLQETFSTQNQPYAVSIPHGCQLLSSLYHQNGSINSVLYMPHPQRPAIATLDNHYVHLWKNQKHIKKWDIKKPRNEKEKTPLTGITHWVYSEAWSCILLSNSHLELKVSLLYFFFKKK